MPDHDDDEHGGANVTTIDVRGAYSEDPAHVEQRDIAHALCHDLADAAAVILITLRGDTVITSTMIHCSVAETEHPTVGKHLLRGLRGCTEQIDQALCQGRGNRGVPPPAKDGVH